MLIIWQKRRKQQTNRPTNKQTNKQRKKQTNKAYLLAIIYCSFNNHVLIIRQNRSLLNVIIIGWLSDYHLMIILLIIWWLSVDNLLIIRWILYYLILLGHLAHCFILTQGHGAPSFIETRLPTPRSIILWLRMTSDIQWSVINDKTSMVIEKGYLMVSDWWWMIIGHWSMIINGQWWIIRDQW